MEIKGKIVSCLTQITGTSVKGPWKKQEYILQTTEQFPKKICFVVWGEKVDEYSLKTNDAVTVSFDLESREFNGKWYTDVKAWKVIREGNRVSVEEDVQVNSPLKNNKPEDDLPF